MNPIQKTINDYLKSGNPSQHTLRCFVGMLETGEACRSDFVECGGRVLWSKVQHKQLGNLSESTKEA
jgi:hypothetical protein